MSSHRLSLLSPLELISTKRSISPVTIPCDMLDILLTSPTTLCFPEHHLTNCRYMSSD